MFSLELKIYFAKTYTSATLLFIFKIKKKDSNLIFLYIDSRKVNIYYYIIIIYDSRIKQVKISII